MAKQSGPAQKAADLVAAAGDLGELAKTFEETTHLLRLRKIARLDVRGLEPNLIAKQLAKSSDEWTLDLVLFLMGIGHQGTKSEKTERQNRYNQIRNEVTHPELVDIDAQLKENQAYALQRISELMHSEDEKVAFAASKEILALGGVSKVQKQMIIIEHRAPDAHVVALRELATWVAPSPRLPSLTEEDVIDI